MERGGAFTPHVHWELLACDLFDRESPPQRDARGDGLRAGLRELWRSTLSEGLKDDGSRSFTWFQLWIEGRGVDLGIEGDRSGQGAGKLRAWVYGRPGPYERGASDDRASLPRRENRTLLDAVVETHERLLLAEKPVANQEYPTPAWKETSAAARILRCALDCDGPGALPAALAAL